MCDNVDCVSEPDRTGYRGMREKEREMTGLRSALFVRALGLEFDVTACIQSLQDLVLVASLPCGIFKKKSYFIISDHLEHTHTHSHTHTHTLNKKEEEQEGGVMKRYERKRKRTRLERKREKEREWKHQTQHWVLCAEVLARHTNSHTHRRWP